MPHPTPVMTPNVPSNAVPVELLPSTRVRTPFAVERMPAPRGWVRFIMYDGKGEYLGEVTMPARKFTEQTTDKLRRWAIRNDDPATPPTLSLLD